MMCAEQFARRASHASPSPLSSRLPSCSWNPEIILSLSPFPFLLSPPCPSPSFSPFLSLPTEPPPPSWSPSLELPRPAALSPFNPGLIDGNPNHRDVFQLLELVLRLGHLFTGCAPLLPFCDGLDRLMRTGVGCIHPARSNHIVQAQRNKPLRL